MHCYALTMTNPEEGKNTFSKQLEFLIASGPKADQLMIFGDVNAREGADYQAQEAVIRKN